MTSVLSLAGVEARVSTLERAVATHDPALVRANAGGAFLSKPPVVGGIHRAALPPNRLVDADPADPLTLRHPGGDILAVFDGEVSLKEGYNYTVDKAAGTVTLKFAPVYSVRFLVVG